jgi:uncharacterized protein
MPRPKCPRRVANGGEIRGLKPVGVPMRALANLSIGRDEVEALRLSDIEGLYHEEAAERMGVSRATFSRIVSEARRKLATALIEQKAILTGPSPVAVAADGFERSCPVHGGLRRRGRWCRCGAEDER